MRKEVKNWLEQAKSDLKKANDNFNINNYDLTSFLCQQAVEKALKALLLNKENKIIKTHDLFFLAKRLSIPEDLIKNCKELSPVYTETRYPDAKGEFIKYSKEESAQDLEIAKEVLEWIEKNL